MEVLGLDSTSGHLLVPLEMLMLISIHMPLVAAAVATTGHIQHFLLEMTTFVILAFMEV